MKLPLLLSLCLVSTAGAIHPLPIAAGKNVQWHSVQISGKEYLPLKQVMEFYQLDQKTQNGKSITLENQRLTATFTLNGQAAQINGVKYFLSEPIREKHGLPHLSRLDLSTLIEPLFRPQFIQHRRPTKTIILDPGHGGKDRGAGGEEARHTLAVALTTKELLEKLGYRVVMTRVKNIGVSLKQRVQIANATEDAVMVSIHFNSGTSRAHGMETYIMSARQPGGNAKIRASVALATAIHSRTLIGLGKEVLNDRGIKRARFNVLSGCKHPTVIIEAGFLTHKKDAALIRTKKFQSRLARSIVRGVEIYNTSLKKRR